MAKDKWGQSCENSNNVAETLWCNVGTDGSGATTRVSSGLASTASVTGDVLEGTKFGPNAD